MTMRMRMRKREKEVREHLCSRDRSQIHIESPMDKIEKERKREPEELSPFIYEGGGFVRPSTVCEVLDAVGSLFIIGIAGGFIYHFTKSFLFTNQTRAKFGPGFRAARANSPRVAGMFALYGLLTEAPFCATYDLRGRRSRIVDYFAANAFAGGLMWAPWGLVAASRAALGFGVLGATGILIDNKRMYASFSPPYPNYNSLNYRYLVKPPAPVPEEEDDDDQGWTLFVPRLDAFHALGRELEI